ncbi:MAG: Uncharacterised protein [Acidimicrobiaceae bacterium]|nr:MAG: Uncharacterised protein [Acidimicrobiaceae bacterium]
MVSISDFETRSVATEACRRVALASAAAAVLNLVGLILADSPRPTAAISLLPSGSIWTCPNSPLKPSFFSSVELKHAGRLLNSFDLIP